MRQEAGRKREKTLTLLSTSPMYLFVIMHTLRAESQMQSHLMGILLRLMFYNIYGNTAKGKEEIFIINLLCSRLPSRSRFLGEKQSEADLSAKPSSEFGHYALLPRTNSLICQTLIIKDVHL